MINSCSPILDFGLKNGIRVATGHQTNILIRLLEMKKDKLWRSPALFCKV